MKRNSLIFCLTILLLFIISAPCFSAVLTVRALVDGRSQLVLRGSDIWWHHIEYSAPGWVGGSYLPTTINGAPWTPVWPFAGDNSFCNCDSSHYTPVVPAMAASADPVGITINAARGTVTILQQPSAANSYTAIIEIYDPAGGADWYDLAITYSGASASVPGLNPLGVLLFALLLTSGAVYLFNRRAVAF